MRTRFPPEPNGRLHIGHVKACLANFEGLDGSCKPDCNLRFDDTNPSTESAEYERLIQEDLAWLGFQPSYVSRTSDYFDYLDKFLYALLDSGEAYLDNSTDIAEQRATGLPSPCRDGSSGDLVLPTPNGPLFDREYCIRLKIAPDHPNTCMRDPVIYRYKEDRHHRCPDRRCFPTYDFSHPIVDYLEAITNSYCTREFFIRRDLYYYLIEKYRLLIEGSDTISSTELPAVFEFNRLEIEGVRLSKRYFLEQIRIGAVTGFDDPSLFTVSGLRNAGHEPEAILDFCRKYVSYVAGSGGVVPRHKFDHAIREYYESHAVRSFGIPEEDMLSVTVLGMPEVHLERAGNERRLPATSKVYINRSDFRVAANKKYKRLTPKKKVWLKYGCLVEYVGHEADDNDHVTSVTVRVVEPDGKYHCAIQWVSHDDHIMIEARDGQRWCCESNITKLHEVIQFERCGYYRCVDGKLTHIIDLKSSFVG